MKYTIVAFEENEGQGITDCVEAADAYEAMKIFASERGAAESTIIVDVLEGDHKSVMPTATALGTTYCAYLLEDE